MSATSSNSCPRCQATFEPGASRCVVCGTPRDGSVVAIHPASKPVAPTPPKRIVDNPWAVLIAVFGAMMILGIPLIWMCRAWSTPTKIFLTILTILYSAVLFWLFYLVMAWSWSRISEAL